MTTASSMASSMALVIFEKAELLIDCISIETATKFAELIDKEKVCVMLGNVQQLVNEAMQSFIKDCTTRRPSSITSRPSSPRPNSPRRIEEEEAW